MSSVGIVQARVIKVDPAILACGIARCPLAFLFTGSAYSGLCALCFLRSIRQCGCDRRVSARRLYSRVVPHFDHLC